AGSGAVVLDAPVPGELQLTGAGARLDVALQSEVGGVPLTGVGAIEQPLIELLTEALADDATDERAGELEDDRVNADAVQDGSQQPPPALQVDVGPLHRLELDFQGVRGEGEFSRTSMGPLS